jgi:hypothetical protein
MARSADGGPIVPLQCQYQVFGEAAVIVSIATYFELPALDPCEFDDASYETTAIVAALLRVRLRQNTSKDTKSKQYRMRRAIE